MTGQTYKNVYAGKADIEQPKPSKVATSTTRSAADA